jgi:hypothetical protein
LATPFSLEDEWNHNLLKSNIFFRVGLLAIAATAAVVPVDRLIAGVDATLTQHQCMAAIESYDWPDGPPSSVTPWFRYDAHGLKAARMIVVFERPDSGTSALSIDCLAGRTALDAPLD